MNATQKSGFTIVELLIVILTIGVLAALVIVSYRGIQERGWASAAQADLKDAARALEQFKVDNGSYPGSYTLVVERGNTNYQYTYNLVANTYCMTGTNGNAVYRVTSTNRTPRKGGCPGHTGAGEQITNYVWNPSFEDGTYDYGYTVGGGGSIFDQTFPTGGAVAGDRYMRTVFTANTAGWGAAD